MKTRLLAVLLAMSFACSGLAWAQPQVIAYWAQNNNGLPGGGFGFRPGDFPQSPDMGAGSLSLRDFNDAASVNANGDLVFECIASFGGSTINAQPGFPSGGSLSPQGCIDNSNNGMSIELAVSTEGQGDIVVSWAWRATSSGFSSRTFSWSVDGQNFNVVATDTGTPTSFALQVYDLTDIEALNDQAEVFFRITLDGATGEAGNNRFDNITVLGTPLGGEDPGAPFACASDPVADPSLTRIHAVQGDGAASPLVGETVEIQAIVVGAFQDTDNFQIGGFFLQEPDARADSNPLTSEGVFISAAQASVGLPDVAIGDEVRVRGVVREQFEQTELFQVNAFESCGSDRLNQVSPVELSLPVDSLADLEAIEGMWVRLTQPLAVTSVFNAARFAEFDVAPERLFQPTQVVSPGAGAQALLDLNDRSRLIIDQGLTGGYRLPFQPGLDGSPLNAFNPIRTGYRIQADFDGVMGFGFGRYRLFALQPAVFDDSENPRSVTPPVLPEGNLRVAVLNVENLFATLAAPGVTCGPGTLACRGATTENELERQLTKLSAALVAFDADIIGLNEIENDDDDVTLALLVGVLNDASVVADWSFIPTGFKGTDAIKNAIIYRSSRVIPFGTPAILQSGVDVTPPFNSDRQRPVLKQAFRHVDSGELLTVSVFHLRSKICGTGAVDDNADQGDGQGCWNALRAQSTASFLAWLETNPTGANTDLHLVLGDFNAYAQEDPMWNLIEAGFVSAVIRSNDNDPAVYSFVFQGQSGSLDHLLASPALSQHVLGAAAWPINADEIPQFNYAETFPQAGSPPKPADFFAPDMFRSSDHDPLIASLLLRAPDPAQVRIVHLAPFASGDETAVDIVVNGDMILTELRFGDSTGYLELPAGSVSFDITLTGATEPAITASVELEAGAFHTVFAHGDGIKQNLGLVLLLDDPEAPPAGEFLLRLGHLAAFAEGAAAAEVRRADGSLVVAVDYTDFSGFLALPAGDYDLIITAPAGDPILIDPVAVAFEPGQVVTVVATGDGDNQRLGVFALPADSSGFFVDINAQVLLDNLVQTFTGKGVAVSATTVPAGLEVELLYDGFATLPINVGSYSVTAKVIEPGFVGAAGALLVIEQAVAGISFEDLVQVFDGQPRRPTVRTEPDGLNVVLSFDSQPDAPSAVGDYVVIATINEPNFRGQATAILRIVEADSQTLALVSQPSDLNAVGEALQPVTRVKLLNGAGEIAVDDNETVIELVLLQEVAGMAEAHTAAVFARQTVSAGVAEFSDLVISTPGTGFRLLVRDADSRLVPVISEAFEVVLDRDIIFRDRFEAP